jgi:hypothetical protein
MLNNSEITRRVIEALKTKISNPKCPLCGYNTWKVDASYVILPLSPNPTQFTVGGKEYPMVPMYCGNCGNTHLINLLTLGFTSEDIKSMEYTENGRK